MMLRILVGCYGVLQVVLRKNSVTDSRRITQKKHLAVLGAFQKIIR